MEAHARTNGARSRHPWETARARAIEEILADLDLSKPRVLDVGCGDGYLVTTLHERLGFSEVVGQDVQLERHLIDAPRRRHVEFVRTLDGRNYRADLLLLLDVLEHVERPDELLRQLAVERLVPGGHVLITVPAFELLFSEHDRSVGHHRRYTRERLAAEVERAGLEGVRSGYLFSSLLAPRALLASLARLAPSVPLSSVQDITRWNGGERLTRFLHGLLVLDNRLCLTAQRHGLRLPGLTIWLTCRTAS